MVAPCFTANLTGFIGKNGDITTKNELFGYEYCEVAPK
jgi:hypothetical protein